MIKLITNFYQHDIVVNATESGDTISFTSRCLKRNMSKERMSNVAHGFVTALRKIDKNPEETFGQFSIFGEHNQQQLWVWSSTVSDEMGSHELDEIEHHLCGFLPDKTDIVAEVITPADQEGQSILAAFICFRNTFDGGDHGVSRHKGTLDINCHRTGELFIEFIAQVQDSNFIYTSETDSAYSIWRNRRQKLQQLV